jgi:[amino group carrier protein]-6-phospho-L-2-aminoadipate/5-phospho-L-glutamate reductase
LAETGAGLSVGVLGATGYAGAELTRLLLGHPRVSVRFASSESQAGQPLAAVVPSLRYEPAAAALTLGRAADLPEVDVAFCCLPTGSLPAVLRELAGKAKRVVNLAGDFRLRDAAQQARHYPAAAEVADLAADFAYWVPDLQPVPEARLVNLPGCMAVATIYALYPLLLEGLVEPEVAVQAATGSSGGGKNAREAHAERAGNVRVHKLHGHRHGPEVTQAVADLTGVRVDLQFSTVSLDVSRGIMATAFFRLLPGVEPTAVRRAYTLAYKGKPFVRSRPASPKFPTDLPMLSSVVGSNVAEVAAAARGRWCVTVTALDNLLKGAAGQAVQAMNLLHGFAETAGLPLSGRWV